MPLRRILAVSLLALACVACTSPANTSVSAPPSTPAPAAPPESSVGVDAASASTPDLSCKVAGDCAVKDVGNCCGYFPACVNKDSLVDPAAVRAECARTGTSSVCGFRDIQACDCVQGQCQAVSGPLEVDR